MIINDWTWNMTRHNHRWQKRLVVNIGGVFVAKEIEDDRVEKKDHEKMMWFSPEVGNIAGLNRMHFDSNVFHVEEKVTGWVVYNKHKTIWNHIPKDEYNYIKFDSNRKCALILEFNSGSYYITGVFLDTKHILEDLLQW